uniref:Mannosyltransferase n=1 Tax=Megaselia scalaris TaxID=36166 RepID=T1GKD7_MEGSC
MSRTLPNILVLPIVLLGLSAWLNRKLKQFIWYSGIGVLIFRFELVIFFGLLLLHDIYFKAITLKSLFKNIFLAGVSILVLTISLDSFFWNRLLWPEGEVLWYNTILNKSSNWGTSPFLWYFYSAIPRATGFTAFFVPFGLYMERRVRVLGLCSLLFVFLYSFLPQKNLASFCSKVWMNMKKSNFSKILALCCAGHLFINILLTIFLLVVSSKNYPGGYAISRLHSAENASLKSVHISNLVAQTGFTRFFQHKDWTYNKTENLKYRGGG